MNGVTMGANFYRALQYGNYRSVTEHLPTLWKKLGGNVRRQKCLVIQKLAVYKISNLRVSSLAAVVTYKVRIINDSSFDEQSRQKKGVLNENADSDTVPQCPCALALTKFLAELLTLRKRFPVRRIPMNTANVSEFSWTSW